MLHDRHHNAIGISMAIFVILVTTVPNLAAQHLRAISLGPESVPLSADDIEKIDSHLKVPGVISTGANSIRAAVASSTAMSLATYEKDALERAREHFGEERYIETIAVSEAILEKITASGVQPGHAHVEPQTRMLKAHAEIREGRYEDALKSLAPITSTPVQDFVVWLRAESLERLGKPKEAADLFAAVAKMDTVLTHRAKVRSAHALFEAKRWREAAKALNRVNATYDEYPRRHVSLYQEAVALDRLEQHVDAADAYLTTWYEFPYREEGRKSRQRLTELEETLDVVPAKMYSQHDLFRRFRMLRINKHWDVADRLFRELREENASADGHSDFEHDIDLQLALNAYSARHFNKALRILDGLAQAHADGFKAGVSLATIHKYRSRVLARLGRIDEALAALDLMNDRASERARLFDRAELLEDHGRYKEALAIYEKLYSAGYKKRWHYTWLLYKTGHYDQAFENFTSLAERSSGQKRAKALYWAGRTLENAGKLDEARAVFREVWDAHRSRYYGIQAANRILDIEQRESEAGTLLASAEDIATAGEYAMDAMDEAEMALQAARAEVSADPRASLKGHDDEATPLSEPAQASAQTLDACDPDNRSEAAYCALQSGEIPAETLKLMQSAFSPASPVGTLLSTGMAIRDGELRDNDNDDVAELDQVPARDPAVPVGQLDFDASSTKPNQYSTSARIYWDGRLGSTTAFASFRAKSLYGPLPDAPKAYDEKGYVGGLERAAKAAGDLFPNLERTWWLHTVGLTRGAQWEARDVAIEFRELSRRWRPSRKPHELNNERWAYYIDNRRKNRSNFWGLRSDEKRFPVPDKASAKRAFLERQQKIYDQKSTLKPLLMNAFKEVGDHFMVRKYTLGTGGWYRRDPAGPARTSWMQAYPRAFPDLVLAAAKRNGVNPYLLWALMTVESSYNPDSISPANALGLLQVIPKTGLKTALMIDDQDFGPKDLLNADVAIQHGAFYFGKLLRKFHGQELLAFAGYNGGPHRVGDWLDFRGGQPLDEFIEEIPYDEARGYAKKVTRFLALYLRIYEGRDRLYIGQNLRPDYRAHPKF